MTVDSVLAIRRKEKKIAYIILNELSKDPDTSIKSNIYPIAKWVEAQENTRNPQKLLTIGQNYLGYLSGSADLYAQRKARYGLLISKLMYAHEELRPSADEILQYIYNKLQHNQVIEDPSGLNRSAKEKRAWYRYMFAYNNFISAQILHQNKDLKVAFLKLASEYSPDMFDKNVSHAYFYDMIFLFGDERNSFKEDYLAALGNDDEKFKTLMAMSMNDPSYKAKAKAYYKDQAKFDVLWLSEFNKKFKAAPLFSLPLLDGVQYTLGNDKKQWTLVDFWGTWCAPCREEHPALQKLYQRTKNGQMPKLNVITIASRDREPDVKAYMQEFKYSFPVAMSDHQIEKAYHVSSWPSKFLISPQGKFVIIPFNVNWEKYVEDYINE